MRTWNVRFLKYSFINLCVQSVIIICFTYGSFSPHLVPFCPFWSLFVAFVRSRCSLCSLYFLQCFDYLVDKVRLLWTLWLVLTISIWISLLNIFITNAIEFVCEFINIWTYMVVSPSCLPWPHVYSFASLSIIKGLRVGASNEITVRSHSEELLFPHQRSGSDLFMLGPTPTTLLGFFLEHIILIYVDGHTHFSSVVVLLSIHFTICL